MFIKWIDFEILPHIGSKINWAKCVGLKTKFKYGDFEGEIKFLDYESPKRRMTIFIEGYTPEYGIKISTKSLSKCSLEMIMKKSYVFLYNVGDIVSNLKIISRYYDQKTKRKTYQYECLKDGYIGKIKEIHLRYGHGCPVCSNDKVMIGTNDLNTTNTELAGMLHDSKNGYKYTENSNQRVDWNCPYCNKLIKNVPISRVKSNGLSCHFCSDGKSYPNKFMSNLLDTLGVNFKNEFSPKWACGKIYDFYIEEKDLIIEMDGSFHYSTGGYYKDMTYFKKTDAFKDRVASEHGIKVIRINCDYVYVKDRYSIIKNNIINSLCNYFDFKNVNFEQINKLSLQSYVIKSLEMYRNGSEIKEIAKQLKMHPATIRNYLSECAAQGLCEYKKEKHIYPIKCLTTNQYFANKSILSRLSKELFGFNIPRGSMNNLEKYKNLLFEVITPEQFNKIKKESPELCFGDSFIL